MDTAQTEKLKALALAATQGKWLNYYGAIEAEASGFSITEVRAHFPENEAVQAANAEFIAGCGPATVLDLIADNERLRAEVERLTEGMEIAINGLQNIAAVEARSAPAAGTDQDAKPLAHGHRGDWYLMANARLLLDQRRTKLPNWALAASLFATGSNSGRQICIDAGIDPDGIKVGRAAIAAHTSAGEAQA